MPIDNSAWIDDQFGGIDTRITKADLPDGAPVPVDGLDNLSDADVDKLFAGVRQAKTTAGTVTFVDPSTQIEHEVPINRADPSGAPAAPPAPEPDASEYPKVIELADGASITFEQTRKGLRATLDSGTGANAERFYGRTETELLQQIAVGKVNATRKIHEMARAERLGTSTTNQPEVDPNPPARITSAGRQLTNQEQAELKELFKTDPIAAQERWYELRHGMRPEDTTAGIRQGSDSKIELYLESVAKSFKIARPNYVPNDEDMYTLVGAMCRDFLKQPIQPNQVEEACVVLAQNGFWTVKNLVIYFDGLMEAGLLQAAQADVDDIDNDEDDEVVPAPAVAVAPPAPAPSPAGRPERIVRPRPGSNASFGIRQSLATAPPVEDLSGPSDAELDNLSDDQIAQLFSGVRRARLGTRR